MNGFEPVAILLGLAAAVWILGAFPLALLALRRVRALREEVKRLRLRGDAGAGAGLPEREEWRPAASQSRAAAGADAGVPWQVVVERAKQEMEKARAAREAARPSVRPAGPAAVGAPAPPSPPTRATTSGGGGEAGPAGLKRVNLEQWLGTRLFVWIAAVAVAFAGIFFVKYSYEHSLIDPVMRLIGAGAFGLALLGAAQWMRRRSENISAALAASACAIFFGCVLGAHYAEHLLAAVPAFFLMTGVTALTVALALRHGVMVAVIALIGGYATPALVGQGEANPGILFAYLVLLQAGLAAVVRRRGWWWLSLLTFAGAGAWAVLWMLEVFVGPGGLWLNGLIIASAVGAMVSPAGVTATAVQRTLIDVLRWTAGIVGLVMLGAMLPMRDFGAMEWLFFGFMGAGCLLLARANERYLGMAALSAAAGVLMLALWAESWRGPVLPTGFGWTLLAMGLLYTLGAWGCMWRSKQGAIWAGLSAVAALAYLVLAYQKLEPPTEHLYGWVCAGLLVFYGATAFAVGRWPGAVGAVEGGGRMDVRGLDAALNVLAGAGCVFAALALPMELEKQWIAFGWALQIPAAAAVYWRYRVAVLKWAAVVLLGLTAMRLLNPAVFTYGISTRPVWNWLLYGYGVPAVAAALAGWTLRRADGKTDAVAAVMEVAAAAFGLALVSLEVHHFFHREEFGVATFGLRHQGTWSSALLLYAMGLLALSWYRGRRLLSYLARVVGILGLIVAAVFGGILSNPLGSGEVVGALPVWNWLLYGYALPAVMAVVLAEMLARDGKAVLSRVVWVAALAGLFLLVGLQVQHYFHRVDMRLGRIVEQISLVQWGTWTATWLAYAGVLLAVDLVWPRMPLRWCAAGVMLLAVVLTGLSLLWWANPLNSGQAVGERAVWNWLLYVYGLPAGLLVGLSRMMTKKDERPLQVVAGVAAMALLFVLVSLEVRQAFHGTVLRGGETTSAEMYSYSAAWLAYGAALLVMGIATRSKSVRWASLVVLLAAIGKVFLYDMRELKDLYRVVSFLGLGLCLLVLAYLYQRLVFGHRRAAAACP